MALALLLVAAEGEPRLLLRGLDGDPVELARGPDERALVVHFWATWCPSCVEELPALARVAAECTQTVRVVAVDVDEEADLVVRFLAEHDVRLPVLLDPRGAAWRSAGFRELPGNLILTGDAPRRTTGPTDEARWRERLHDLGCAAR